MSVTPLAREYKKAIKNHEICMVEVSTFDFLREQGNLTIGAAKLAARKESPRLGKVGRDFAGAFEIGEVLREKSNQIRQTFWIA